MSSSEQSVFRTTSWLMAVLAAVMFADFGRFACRYWNSLTHAGEVEALAQSVRMDALLLHFERHVEAATTYYDAWVRTVRSRGQGPTQGQVRDHLAEWMRSVRISMDESILNFRIGRRGACACGDADETACPPPETTEWFQRAVASPKTTIVLPPRESARVGGRPVVTMSRLLEDGDSVFAVDIATEVFSDILERPVRPFGDMSLVVDSGGRTVFRAGACGDGGEDLLRGIGTGQEGTSWHSMSASGDIFFCHRLVNGWRLALCDRVSHVLGKLVLACLWRSLGMLLVFVLLLVICRHAVRRIKAAFATLHEAEQAEAFIARLLKDVMSLPLEENAVEVLLRGIGERLGVDRCYVCTCREIRGARVTNGVYEWCDAGIPSERAGLECKGPQGLPQFCDRIEAGEDYSFPSTSGLPPETRAWFERRKVKAFFSTPITNPHGVSVGYLGLDFVRRPFRTLSASETLNLHEVAGVVRICLARQQAADILRNAEKEKESFFAAMSHDIRTPLNSIIGFSHLLKGEGDEAVRTKYLDNIAFSGETLLFLVNDILDFFRFKDGAAAISRTTFDLEALVRRVLAAFLPAAEEKGIRLVAETADPPLVVLDEMRIRRVLFNLVGNAVKFTDRGCVTVRVEFLPGDDARGVLRIAVLDTGRGISPRDIDKVMQPYVSIEASDTARGGTGLGLAICRLLVEKANGTISLGSEPGKGTSVVVTIPDVEYHAREEAARAPADLGTGDARSARDFRALRVLVVDDLEMNRCVLAAACRRLGVGQVLEAASGAEALARLGDDASSPPDVVLTDVKMPGMDGYELIRRIREIPALAALPVCLVTADVEARKHAREAGAFDILLKPILPASLEQVLSSVADM